MATHHQLLAATDFSDCAAEAVMYAANIAAGLNAKLIIAYVNEPNVFNSKFLAEKIGPSFLSMTASQIRETALELIETELKNLVHNVKKSCSHTAYAILEGPTAQALTDFAKENECTMIIVGTHGHSNLEHFMYGSVTDRLLRVAGCPVLVVRRKEDDVKKKNSKSRDSVKGN